MDNLIEIIETTKIGDRILKTKFKIGNEFFSDFLLDNKYIMPIGEYESDGYLDYVDLINFIDDDNRFERIESNGLTSMTTIFLYNSVELELYYNSYDDGSLEIIYNGNTDEDLIKARIGATILDSHLRNKANTKQERG